MEEEKKEQTAQEYWKGFPEAPYSNTFKWVDAGGFEHMTTIRAYSPKTLLGQIDVVQGEILAREGRAAGGHKSKPEAPGAGTYDDPKTFKCTSIIVEMANGKTYTKVTGEEDKFPKWPVVVWPETLEKAGIDPQAIPTEGISFVGTAYYINNDNGNPAKVIRLERDPF